MFKSLYNQFVNFLQGIPGYLYVGILLLLVAITLFCIVKFFKAYNGTQKSFVKISLLIIIILLIAIIIYLTYVR